MNRRFFLASTGAIALSACASAPPPVQRRVPVEPAPPPPPPPPMPAHYGAIPDEPYPVPAIPDGIVPEHLWRQEVDNPFPRQPEGAIVVDPDAANLHLILGNGRAMRYGVSVGAAGFGWDGDAVIQYGREWPRWKVPAEMIARQPEYAPYSVENGGMDPGPGNPLGARALYLFQNDVDTLYRIHGGCEPKYLGQAVSSGCIRMLDHDVIDLYERVPWGSPVTVLHSVKPERLVSLY